LAFVLRVSFETVLAALEPLGAFFFDFFVLLLDLPKSPVTSAYKLLAPFLRSFRIELILLSS